MKKVICLLLIAVLMLCGCGTTIEEKKNTSASAPSKEPTSVSAASIEPTSVSAASIEKSPVSVRSKKATPSCVKIKKVAANYFSSKENKEIKVENKLLKGKKKWFSYNIKYPALKGEEYKSFNKLVEKVVWEKSGYNQICGDLDDEDTSKCTIELIYKVRKITNRFISISFEGYFNQEHTAHPTYFAFCINYDLQNENEVVLSNVVSDMDDFSKEMLKAIKNQMETKELVEGYQYAWKLYKREELKKSHDFCFCDGKLYC